MIDTDYFKAYNSGFKDGKQAGHETATDFFYQFLYSLEGIEGVGSKTADKVRNEFLKAAEKVVSTYGKEKGKEINSK